MSTELSVLTQPSAPGNRAELKSALIKLLKFMGIGGDIPEAKYDFYLEVCSASGVSAQDILNRDVFPLPIKNKEGNVTNVIPVPSYTYYLKRASKYPTYDGNQVFYNDGTLIINSEERVSQYGKTYVKKSIDRSSTLACTVAVFIKGREHPESFTAWISEFANDSNDLWTEKPRHMLFTKAISHALRQAFPVEFSGGVFTDEDEVFEPAGEAIPYTPPAPILAQDQCSYETREALAAACSERKIRVTELLRSNGLTQEALTEQTALEMIKQLRAMPTPPPATPPSLPQGRAQAESVTPLSEPKPSPVPQPSLDETIAAIQTDILDCIKDMEEFGIEKFDQPSRVEKSVMKHLNTKTVQECIAIPLLESYRKQLKERIAKFAEEQR